MIHGYNRFNVISAAFFDNISVEFQSLFIYFARAVRQDSCPCDRKTVGFQPEFREEGNVFFISVIVITGNREIGNPFRVLVHIDDRRAFPILICSAFHLIGRGGSAPQKILRKWFQIFINHMTDSFYFRAMKSSPGFMLPLQAGEIS